MKTVEVQVTISKFKPECLAECSKVPVCTECFWWQDDECTFGVE